MDADKDNVKRLFLIIQTVFSFQIRSIVNFYCDYVERFWILYTMIQSLYSSYSHVIII